MKSRFLSSINLQIIKVLLITSFVLLISACHETSNDFGNQVGHFPDTAVNFTDANSIYDDMNSTAPYIFDKSLFHFSSNRLTKGGTFDIVGHNMELTWHKSNGTLTLSLVDDSRYNYLDSFFRVINTPQNEFGPFSFSVQNVVSNYNLRWRDVVLYSSDAGGNSDIMLAYYDTTTTLSARIMGPYPINLVNTNKNELYPSFYGSNWYFHNPLGYQTGNIEEMCFCADYDGNFDIYRVKFKPQGDFVDSLISAKYQTPEKISSVSSSSEDKCPFINGNLMVFSSNRPGGFGGYDLYYSVRQGDSWSEPVNFGNKINTAYDEFRPMVIYVDGFDNNLMFFSSNRPSGKGGFDLYYIGISQVVK